MKFVSQAYFPLDKEIIREAWVAGDLKGRLGVEHRRAKRNTDPEDASLFRPHVRGGSDGSDQGDYEPVAPRSAPKNPAPAGAASLAPQTRESMTQYASDIPPRYQEASPAPTSAAISYYSTNEAPRASPSPGFQQVPLSSRSLTPAMAEQQGRHHYYNPPRSPVEYEMVDRSESALENHAQERSNASRASRTTNTSFVTASDGEWDEGDDGVTVRQPPADNRSSYYPVHPGEAI
jgi:phospholipid-translocating ATPase